MNTAQLQEYLETAVGLEKALYFQDWALIRCQRERRGLVREKFEKRPTPPQAPGNPLPGILKKMVISFLIAVAAAFGIGTLIFGLSGGCLVGMFGGISLGLVFAATIYLTEGKQAIEDWGRRRTKKDDKQDAFQRYEEAKLQYPGKELTYPPLEARVNARQEVLAEMIRELKEEQQASRAALKAHYDQGVLYPKYRRFSMVCCLCEYIQSGRRDKLEGPQGAYELLEEELQQRKVVSELDDLDWKGIRDRQYSMAVAMEDVMKLAAAMSAEIDRRVEARAGDEGEPTPRLG